MYLGGNQSTHTSSIPTSINGWSVNARVLSFMEQNSLWNATNFSMNQTAPENMTVTATSIPSFICPSENNPQPLDTSFGVTAPSTVGWSMGDWYVWGGFGGLPNRTAFGPNVSRKAADFQDGLSLTILASEIRCHQSISTDCDVLNTMNSPNLVIPPGSSPDYVTSQLGNGGACVYSETGHTSWADGSVNQSGMTTAWTPNTRVIVSMHDGDDLQIPSNADLDLESTPEINGGPTYAAITVRSWHPGGVNALFGDGSVRFLKQSINGATWRALGSVNGSEIVSADEY